MKQIAFLLFVTAAFLLVGMIWAVLYIAIATISAS
jgi:hypothetical protein